MSFAQITSSTLSTTIISLPTPISSSSSSISSSSSNNKFKCSISCYITTAIILVLVIVCLILLRLSYIYLQRKRRTSVVDIESNINNNNNNNNNNNIIIADINNNNEILSTTRLNSSEMLSTSDTLIIPQNALIRNRHTISVRSHTIHTSSDNHHHSLLKRTRTTISSISSMISNNFNNYDNSKLRNDFIKNFMFEKKVKNNNNNNNNNIEILVDKFPLPPPLNNNNNNNNNNNMNEVDELAENIKKFNKPWEFAPEVASKEMNTIKVKNRGRIIDINPESWSSVVKDACVQSNYPFYVPLPRSSLTSNDNDVRRESMNEKTVDEKVDDDKVDEKVDETVDNKIDHKTDEMKVDEKIEEFISEPISESISEKIRKKLQKKKRLQQLITRKSSKIEETTEEYKDGEGFNYFEITILEKENPHTNIVIGVATKPFPCYKLPGHTEYSIGYHSINGQVYQNSMYNGWEYGPSWNNIHTTIGCGYKPLSGEIYFTFNGFILGTLFTTEVEYDALNEKRYYLFPSIGANGKCKIRVNFGEEKFVYNEVRSLKEEEIIIEKNIENIKNEGETETESESNYSDEENIIYIKNPINNNSPLGKWKDVRLETDEKEKIWWNTTTNTIVS